MTWHVIGVRSKDAQKQLKQTSLISLLFLDWNITVTSSKDLVSIEGSGFQTSDKGSRPFFLKGKN